MWSGLLILAVGCSGTIRLSGKAFDGERLAEIESHIGVTFPNGTTGINYVKYTHREPWLAAKLKIPRNSQEAFVEALRDSSRKDINGISSGTTSRIGWWNFREDTVVVKRQYSHHTRIVEVNCSKQGDELFVYVFWFSI